jgi:hypothetical protein
MSTTLDHRDASAAAGPDSGTDVLCQHEFADGGLCAFGAMPDAIRCTGHQDDGQPDYLGGGGR